MEIITLLGLGLVTVLLCMLLRPIRPEYALLLSLGMGGILLYRLWGTLEQLGREITGLLGMANLPQGNVAILLKCLGLCFLTQLGCEAARDAGESAIASKIELTGKVMILAASLPLFGQILRIITRLL